MQQSFTIPTDRNKETLEIKSPVGPVYCFTADGRKIRLAEEDTLFGKTFYLPAGIDDITGLEFVDGGGEGASGYGQTTIYPVERLPPRIPHPRVAGWG
jgi:hypothetical protein